MGSMSLNIQKFSYFLKLLNILKVSNNIKNGVFLFYFIEPPFLVDT